MRIELPMIVGAKLAFWRRSYASLTFWEVLAKGKGRLQRPALRWYRKGLQVAFRARNMCTRGAVVPVEAGGISIHLLPEGQIAYELWSGVRFERAELEFILRMLRPGMTFFDVGANSGLYSILAGKKMAEGCSIFAFEPCPSTFTLLEKNILSNHLSGIQAHPVALSEQSGEACMHVNAAWKDGLNSLQDPSHVASKVVAHLKFQTETLDEFIVREEIAKVDVMKVEVQGAELLVFRGGRALLNRPDAPVILYEGYTRCTACFHYHPAEIMWQLEEFGYELFVLDVNTGQIRLRRPGESYDAMMVAVKPTHARYAEIAPVKAAA